MTVEIVHAYPPLIFKDSFHFTAEHIETSKLILNLAGESNSYLEKGAAKSSVADQINAPHKHEVFKDFFEWLQNTSEHILKIWNLKDPENFYIGNSWINKHDHLGETLYHNHGFSAISCVAYIQLPDNSGFTEFKDPHYEIKSLHEYNKNLQEYFPVKVKQDDVVFFPGWLMHRSQPNLSRDQRIVLSTNLINFTHRDNFKFKSLFS